MSKLENPLHKNKKTEDVSELEYTPRYELGDEPPYSAKIKVIGLGGGGGNAVEYMMAEQIEGVEFVCANTDVQALNHSNAATIQLGEKITKGLGAGANPEIGRQAAEESRDRICKELEGFDMVFLPVCMGGGTGTGSSPVVAEIAREMGILTVAIVTLPFTFEGRKRMEVAKKGIENLTKFVDLIIPIQNDKLLEFLGKEATLTNSFKSANNILRDSVREVSSIITFKGLINVDFADVRTVISGAGKGVMGTGVGSGEHRAREAAEAAIASPLLEDVDLTGARGILVNITAGDDMAIGEFQVVGETIRAFASDYTNVVIGTVLDKDMGEELRVTIVVAGLSNDRGDETGGAGSQHLKTVRSNIRKDGTTDYHQLDRPTYLRHQEASKQVEQIDELQNDKEVEYLDIPAFLRRQED